MTSFITKNWKVLTGLAVTSTIAYLLLKDKNEEEVQSGFLGSPNNKVVTMTLSNNTGSQQVQTLFNAFTDSSNPSVGVSISGSSLSEFNRSLLSEPIRINQIEVRATGANQSVQSQNIITKVCKDASGVSDTDFYNPYVSPNQFQSGITIVQPNNLVLNGVCFLQYPVEANTTVNLVFRYDVVQNKVVPEQKLVSAPVLGKFKKKRKKFWFR